MPVLAQLPLDPDQARRTFAQEYGLPEDSKPSDIIQHIITQSGHTVMLLQLMQCAVMMGADIQLYITDREAAVDGHQLETF